MYVERSGALTLKQKLDIRSDLRSLEYINALSRLIDHTEGYEPKERAYIMKHLVEVSADAMTRSWPVVRAWSQFIFDEVERKNLKWRHKQQIQNHRFTLP